MGRFILVPETVFYQPFPAGMPGWGVGTTTFLVQSSDWTGRALPPQPVVAQTISTAPLIVNHLQSYLNWFGDDHSPGGLYERCERVAEHNMRARVWRRSEIVDHVEAECIGTVLAQRDGGSWCFYFTEHADIHNFRIWWSTKKKAHQFIIARDSDAFDDVKAWIGEHVRGERELSFQPYHGSFMVHIRDDSEAVHFKLRWSDELVGCRE